VIRNRLTGIAGIIAPERIGLEPKLQSMLEAMQARGSIRQTLVVNEKRSNIGIGSCSHHGEWAASNLLDRTSFASDGPTPADLQMDEIGGQFSRDILSEATGSGGPFACVSISAGRLLVGRDTLGQKPLYMGRGKGMIAFATLKKALQSIGLPEPKPVQPGQLVSFSRTGKKIVSDQALSKPREIHVAEDDALKELSNLMIQSLEEGLTSDSALAFSGGLDSSLVAKAALENDYNPELITVAMNGQQEIAHAKRVSQELGLDWTARELTTEELLEAVPDVIDTIESVDPVLVGISLPIYFACKTAQEMGLSCILAGQLSDELFAGYGRFEELALEKSVKSAASEIWRSVLAASTNDFEPGDKLAVSHRMELRCPFAFLPLVKYALRLPIGLKLRVEGREVVRKYILRRLAAHWKLPGFVVEKPKKAVQYSSGVQKVLLKEARRKKMPLGEFVKSMR